MSSKPLHETLFPDLLGMEVAEAKRYYDAREGYNLAESGARLIEASHDLEALKIFLNRIEARSKHTYRAYKRELERLLWWARASGYALLELDVQAMQHYLDFLANPPPGWSGPRRPRHHPQFRPFEGPLSEASVRQALQIISSCFSFLVEAGYMRANPCALVGKKRYVDGADASKKVERFLDQDVWKEFWQYLENLPQSTPKETFEAQRAQFLFTLLYLQAPRVSEVSAAVMGDIHRISGKWWWRIKGKGGKTASVPVGDQMLSALRRYRTYLKMTPLPLPEEQGPLLVKHRGHTAPSTDMIYKLVKRYTDQAASLIGAYMPEAKTQLEKASTHWFRHTAITHQAEHGIDIHYLKENARHSSIQTTQRYIHADQKRFHEAMASHRLDDSKPPEKGPGGR